MKHLVLIGLGLVALASPALAQDDGPKLALQVRDMMGKYCYSCHGQAGASNGGFSKAGDIKGMIDGGLIVAKDPKKGRIARRMIQGADMPPESVKERPTEAELAAYAKWVELGAPLPVETKVEPRPFLTIAHELDSMYLYLKKTVQIEDRPYIRFFTMTHLHNREPQGERGDRVLRLYRAALSKLLNSLSWKADIVIPVAIDKYETVFAVDIRQLDWDQKKLWMHLIKAYPYGLKHHQYPEDRNLNDIALDIYKYTETDIPAVRVDWFVATASRPPLYDLLLQLPKNAYYLEQRLKVNVALNFERNVMIRAGFTSSGVSAHNRMVERHPAEYGAYWKSYDFQTSAGRGNLYVYPLGPEFKGNPYNKFAFKQAGGELIFNLPNGLQGYMLVDGKDDRIEEGPIKVVDDHVNRTGGTAEVINGLSCMVCHNKGMIPLIDDHSDKIRVGNILGGAARDKVLQLYRPAKEMDGYIQRDTERFMTSYDRAVAQFLRVGPDKDKGIDYFPEPISAIAKWYVLQDLSIDSVAYDLLYPDARKLGGIIENNDYLRRLGLAPLGAQGGLIKRELWEFLDDIDIVVSPYQHSARILRLGTPVRQKFTE